MLFGVSVYVFWLLSMELQNRKRYDWRRRRKMRRWIGKVGTGKSKIQMEPTEEIKTLRKRRRKTESEYEFHMIKMIMVKNGMLKCAHTHKKKNNWNHWIFASFLHPMYPKWNQIALCCAILSVYLFIAKSAAVHWQNGGEIKSSALFFFFVHCVIDSIHYMYCTYTTWQLFFGPLFHCVRVCDDEHKSLLNCINDIGTYNLSGHFSNAVYVLSSVGGFVVVVIFIFIHFLFSHFDIIMRETVCQTP